jgi:hypothetical protein
MTKAELLELLKAGRKRRFREQTGTVVKRSDGFYIRYSKDVDGMRTKVTERLCDLSTSATSVKLQQRTFMSGVNTAHHAVLQSPTEAPALTIGGFWSATYLPWVKESRQWSTHRGYQKIWDMYLKHELESKTLSAYRTGDGSQLLTGSAATLKRNSLAHVRSVMSGIFSHATRAASSTNRTYTCAPPTSETNTLRNAPANPIAAPRLQRRRTCDSGLRFSNSWISDCAQPRLSEEAG